MIYSHWNGENWRGGVAARTAFFNALRDIVLLDMNVDVEDYKQLIRENARYFVRWMPDYIGRDRFDALYSQHRVRDAFGDKRLTEDVRQAFEALLCVDIKAAYAYADQYE